MRNALIMPLSVLTMLCAASAAERGVLMDSPIADVDKEFKAIELLPPGSVLDGVSLPRYENHKPSVLVTSPYMKVESRVELSGKNVLTYLYDTTGRETTRIFMAAASYFFNTKFLISKDTTVIRDFRMEAESTGVTFDTTRKVGFMHGPVTTVIHVDELKKDQQQP